MENIMEKAGGLIGKTIVNSTAMASALGILIAGKGTPQSMAGAFAVYGSIKMYGDLGGKEFGKGFDTYLKQRYGFDTDKFVNDNIDKFRDSVRDFVDPIVFDYWADKIDDFANWATKNHFSHTQPNPLQSSLFTISSPTINEKDEKAVFVVTNNSNHTMSIRLNLKNGSAELRQDYAELDPQYSIITLNAGESQDIPVAILNDEDKEDDETFMLEGVFDSTINNIEDFSDYFEGNNGYYATSGVYLEPVNPNFQTDKFINLNLLVA